MEEQGLTIPDGNETLPEALAEVPGSLAAMNGEKVLPIDVELVKKAAAGDHAAFTTLFYQTYRYAFVLISAMLSSDEDIRDALQETYLRVYTGLPRLREPEAFLGWLKVIAKNCAASIQRQRDSNATYVPVDSEEEPFLAEEEQRETALDIRAVLQTLPQEQARLLVLVYYDGMKLSEIARMQEVPASTVRSRFSAAKRALVQALKGRGIDRTVYGRSGFLSAVGTALRDAIGTDVLSAAVAQEILDEVLHAPKPASTSYVVAKLTKRRRDAAILRIAALVVMLSLAASAVMVAVMTKRDTLPVAQPVPITTTTDRETVITTTSGTVTASEGTHISTTVPSEGEMKVPPSSATTGTEPEEATGTTSPSVVTPTEPIAGATAKTTGTATPSADTTSTTTSATAPSSTFVPDYRAGHANTVGNTANNLRVSGGKMAKQDGWLYFSAANTRVLCKAKADGSQRQVLYSGQSIHHINVVGDWIYFADTCLYRVRTDGQEQEMLVLHNVSWLLVEGDTVYYTVLDGGLYALSLANEKTVHLWERVLDSPIKVGERILWNDGAGCLYRYDCQTGQLDQRYLPDVYSIWAYTDTEILYEEYVPVELSTAIPIVNVYRLDVTSPHTQPQWVLSTPPIAEEDGLGANYVEQVVGDRVVVTAGDVYSVQTGQSVGKLSMDKVRNGVFAFGENVYWYAQDFRIYRTNLQGGKSTLVST